jgi:uncharacterized membrane protein
MTTSSHLVLTVEEFAERVDRACSDLPDPVRRRLMADLDTHLREVADQGDLVSTVGDPEDYARDLREALDIPGGPSSTAPASNTPPSDGLVAARRRPRWLLPVLAGVLAVLALAAVIGFAVSRSSNTSQPIVPAATSNVTISAVNPLPTVVGHDVTQASAELVAAGFQVRVVTEPGSTARPGTVIAQDPDPGALQLSLPTGSTVTLHVAG